ncbi:MAG: hypothetical protein O3A13_15015 [Proteobacteria bacterium]|nr:hypothetical protein [Pseudomonadota bacterium]
MYTDKAALDAHRAELRARYAIVHSVNAEVDAALETEEADALLQALLQNYKQDAGILRSVESRINAAGYAAAFADELDRAEALLELNTRLFPQSANTWDSLAEIVEYRGDKDRAAELYRKAREVDPG